MCKLVKMVLLIVIALIFAGCQLDVQGPSATVKILRKGENNNQEFLSRGSGMTGGNSYASGGGGLGMTSNAGKDGNIWVWGNSSK